MVDVHQVRQLWSRHVEALEHEEEWGDREGPRLRGSTYIQVGLRCGLLCSAVLCFPELSFTFIYSPIPPCTQVLLCTLVYSCILLCNLVYSYILYVVFLYSFYFSTYSTIYSILTQILHICYTYLQSFSQSGGGGGFYSGSARGLHGDGGAGGRSSSRLTAGGGAAAGAAGGPASSSFAGTGFGYGSGHFIGRSDVVRSDYEQVCTVSCVAVFFGVQFVV